MGDLSGQVLTLADLSTLEGVTYKLYRQADGGLKLYTADAIIQARVARIYRASDYDFKKKEVILWSPPTK